MTAQLLQGTEVAESVLADVKRRAAALAGRGTEVGLGTILVGDDGPSASYVRKKHEACEAVGIRSHHQHLPTGASQRELEAAVDRFNDDPAVHAYLIQHPVPRGLDFNAALARMDPAKDGDGLHPINLGKLVLQESGPVPCTPAGIQAMLVHFGIPTAGREVVIIGRGPTLGRPLALLLSLKAEGANAAVTVVHSGVRDVARFTRRADILVAAVGSPGFVRPEMVREGAVVISGGISWQGRKLLADVDESVAEVASWITPRLGGVGPTTVAMLLRNTIEAAERQEG
ncbi:MAG: bifunctional 5,10-methylenetetrahydrofolate dehydrogenase/5,10-methenyltetrahydrofolate cyclohydrolase [Acidobacteria bacterium]|nr:MAG: bifunctional 5,10-methylenetetrahydrofolate dehydrogenase/5,10-methenyltetrahydrofolate cyclohydrolase [Acidobacteriota bacterium]REK08301.1 MAG: bifunctional 5,10-methylenetetrahydrofolate dehydrogenase/5,10-methenyltetrahydrofolate cyclohydrolase [Acidobacteriota bacterium]